MTKNEKIESEVDLYVELCDKNDVPDCIDLTNVENKNDFLKKYDKKNEGLYIDTFYVTIFI